MEIILLTYTHAHAHRHTHTHANNNNNNNNNGSKKQRHKNQSYKTQQNSNCTLCGDRNETINHIISKCSKLAQKEYKTRHDWVGKVIPWMTIIPIVIGAFGTVTKGLLKDLEDLEVGGRVETIQTTALLKIVRILRRVLET